MVFIKALFHFISFLDKLWIVTMTNKTENERTIAITIDNFIFIYKDEINKYEKLNSKGEYSVKFLLVIAKLLMQQEKNNMEEAYMFKRLLNALIEGEDIFKIISISSHTGKR